MAYSNTNKSSGLYYPLGARGSRFIKTRPSRKQLYEPLGRSRFIRTSRSGGQLYYPLGATTPVCSDASVVWDPTQNACVPPSEVGKGTMVPGIAVPAAASTFPIVPVAIGGGILLLLLMMKR